jgi:hypothetical protein
MQSVTFSYEMRQATEPIERSDRVLKCSPQYCDIIDIVR